jgi:hypothetical protein
MTRSVVNVVPTPVAGHRVSARSELPDVLTALLFVRLPKFFSDRLPETVMLQPRV